MVDAFGDKGQEILDVMRASSEKQEAWANSVTSEGRLVEPWRTGFHWLDQFPEVQAEQRRRAREDYFVPCLATAKGLGLTSALGLALCFDIHVQNGGIKKAARDQIERALARRPPAGEKDLRRIIANAVADNAHEKYREDVRQRDWRSRSPDGARAR